MNKILFNLAITCSVLAISCHNANAMNSDQDESVKCLKNKTLYKDDTSRSASTCILNDQKQPAQKKRILSFAGGGIRGAGEAAFICVLEELLNHGNQGEWKYFIDEFDAVGGTSTGSLLSAGLAYKGKGDKKYTAIDVLKMYARYGYKIFDEQKRLANGTTHAKYSNEGLLKLLNIYFNDGSTFEDTTLPLYVVAHLAKRADNTPCYRPLIHSSRNDIDLAIDGLKTPKNYLLVSALCGSASAPTYLPGQVIKFKGEDYEVTDGGLAANQPVELIYDFERLRDQEENKKFNYDLFAFGTGEAFRVKDGEKTIPLEALDRGASSLIETVIIPSFACQVNASVEACNRAVVDKNSEATFFAHLNPRYERDELDDTSTGYMQYMWQKTFDILLDSAKSEKPTVFQAMVERLGMKMPSVEVMQGLIEIVKRKLYSISEDTYKSIVENPQGEQQKVQLEQEWILRILNSVKTAPSSYTSIIELPFAVDFLNSLNVDGKVLTQDERTHFFQRLMKEFSDFDKSLMTKAEQIPARFEDRSPLAKAIIEEFNTLPLGDDVKISYKSEVSPYVAMQYVTRKLRDTVSLLDSSDDNERRTILSNLSALKDSVGDEGCNYLKPSALPIENSNLESQGSWYSTFTSYSNVVYEFAGTTLSTAKEKALDNPGTTGLVVGGALLTGGTSLFTSAVFGGAGAAYTWWNASDEAKEYAKDDNRAPAKGTLSYELYRAFRIYLTYLNKKYGL